MAVETNPQPFKPLDGEEVKQDVLRHIERQLSEDTRFKKSVVYHEPRPIADVTIKSRTMPDEHVLVEVYPQLKTWKDDNRILTEKLDRFAREWKGEIEKVKAAQEAKMKQLEEENEQLKIENLQLKTELRSKADSVRHNMLEPGWQSFTVHVEGETVLEPERTRQELASYQPAPSETPDLAATGETVGKQPEEIVVAGSDGRFAPAPKPANEGAVVGGGQRPSNVVGRPK